MTAEEAQKNGGAAADAGVVVDQPKEVALAGFKLRLYVEGNKATEAVAFFKAAFGAEEVERDVNLKRKVDQEAPALLSSELKIGGVTLIVSDFVSDGDASLVKSASNVVISLDADDVDAAVEKAVKAGATSDGFTDDDEGRVGKLKDPYGNTWLLISPAKAPVPVPDTTPVVASVSV